MVINLALHDEPRYSLADERATAEGLGMAYVHIPAQFSASTAGDFDAFAASMDAHRSSKVCMHCAANKRVSVFLGLSRSLRCGRPEHEAFELQRSVWQPDAAWSAYKSRMLAGG